MKLFDAKLIMRIVPLVLIVALAGHASPALAQREQLENNCENNDGSISNDQQIAACTALIGANEISPSDLALALAFRGEAYSRQGKYDAAIADFNWSLQYNGQDGGTWGDRGYAYFKKGNFKQAIGDFTQAIRYDSSNSFAYYYRGDCYIWLENYDSAIADFTQSIRLKANYAWAWNDRGWAYYKKRDLDRAIPDFLQATRLDPNNAVAFGNLGDVYSEKKQYDQAIQYYDASLRIDSRNPFALHMRGIAYAEKGNLDRAIVDFEAAIRLKPDYQAAIEDRALAYRQRGQSAPPLATAPLGGQMSRGELARAIQAELQRVGCDPGTPDGQWGPASQRALAAYNHSTGTTYTAPGPELLQDLKGRNGLVCSAAGPTSGGAPPSSAAPAPSPELSLAGTWKGSSDCPLDTGFTLTLAPAGPSQYKISGNNGIAGWVSGNLVHMEAQILINHIVWDGAVDSPSTMSGTVSPSLMLGGKCHWHASKI